MPVIDDSGNIIFDPTFGPDGSIVSASDPSQVSTPATPAAPTPAPAAAAASPTSAPPTPAGPTPAQQDAFAQIQTVLGQYGISGLGDWLWGEIKNNNPESQIMLDLQNQPAFLSRFPGMKALTDAGLPAITPAQYLATENEYKRNLADLGIDTKGLTPADFVPLFASNLDPTEVRSRMDIYQNVATTFSPTMRQNFDTYAGMKITDDDVYNMFQDTPQGQALVKQYALATGTTTADASHFTNAVGAAGAALPSVASLQYAQTRATNEEKALFHPLTRDPIMGTQGMPTDMAKEEKASF